MWADIHEQCTIYDTGMKLGIMWTRTGLGMAKRGLQKVKKETVLCYCSV